MVSEKLLYIQRYSAYQHNNYCSKIYMLIKQIDLAFQEIIEFPTHHFLRTISHDDTINTNVYKELGVIT